MNIPNKNVQDTSNYYYIVKYFRKYKDLLYEKDVRRGCKEELQLLSYGEREEEIEIITGLNQLYQSPPSWAQGLSSSLWTH